MCTLTWQIQSEGYELWFSRDESVNRPKAHPPKFWLDGWALAPVDPQGGGTWLAVNQAGMSFALLNAYELTSVDNPSKKLISRGTVIPGLLKLTSVQALSNHLRQQLSVQFAPFRLVVIWPDGSLAQWCWQGQALIEEQATAPVVSSGSHTEEVRAIRSQLFTSMHQDLHGFHRSHWPDRSYRSVCMHRAEAHTVSLSHVKVLPTHVHMQYQAGSPCQEGPWQTTMLKRQGV